MNVKRISLAIVLAAAATAGEARNLPHFELVSRYLRSGQYTEVLGGCPRYPGFAPAATSGKEVECWAAKAAKDLSNEPEGVIGFVLSGSALDAALSRCKSLSMEQRIRSRECAAANRANTFVSLRLPRTIDTLKPLNFSKPAGK
jgi:hypothetical protein